MSTPIIQISGASISLCPALPLHALHANSRNYKAEVQKELELKAFYKPISTPYFKDITEKAIPYLEAMAKHYNLTIYYNVKIPMHQL